MPSVNDLSNEIHALFRSGLNTLEISDHLGGVRTGWTEATVSRYLRKAIDRERSQRTVLEFIHPKRRGR